MDRIKILVVSDKDWKTEYNIPDFVKIYTYKTDEIKKKDIFELTILEKNIDEDDFKVLKAHSYSYCLLVAEDLVQNDSTKKLVNQRMGGRYPIFFRPGC